MIQVRERRSISGLVILAIVASILVVASRADGRDISRATPNDGGAWIIDRSQARIAHADHGTGESTIIARIEDTGGTLPTSSILEAEGAVLIHNEAANSVRRVTPATAAIDVPVVLEEGIEVHARPGGVALFDPATSALQWPDTGQFAGEPSAFPVLFDAEATLGEALPGRLVLLLGVDAGDSETPVAAIILSPTETEPARAVFVPALGEPVVHNLPDSFEPTTATGAGDAVVLIDGDRGLVATRNGTNELPSGAIGDVAALQRSGEAPDQVSAILADGGYVVLSLVGGNSASQPDVGITPILDHPQQQPIFHDGCLHFLGELDGVVDLWGFCADRSQVIAFEPFAAEDTTIPANSQIRLVNGEIWLDELNGFARRLRDDLTLERTLELPDPDEAEEAEENEDGVEVEEFDPDNPDAELSDADQFDQDSVNEQPEAADDEAGTRPGRDVFVDVLANDVDPNGDVLSVDEVSVTGDLAEQISVAVAPDGAGIVVTQPTRVNPGAAQIDYMVSDGRGGSDSATVTFTVHDDESNQPPNPAPDRLRAWAGAEIRADLLANDTDPEADPLVMTGISSDSIRVLSEHPSGVVVLEIPAEQDTFELTYTVSDDRGADAEGVLSIEVVNPSENTVPDARHDRAQIAVGDRVRLDLLANDVDPGGLELIARTELTQLSGPGLGDGVEADLNEDGQFNFEPSAPGTYVFSYEVSNREDTDDALIRIDVEAEAANRAPVAVRDDVVLGIGETRLVRIFDNDGDPDGDVIDFSFFSEDDAVSFELVDGVGALLSLTGSPSQPAEIQYRVSDGELESSFATIFVSSSGTAVENAAPITVDDSVQARAGRTSRLFPLRNDFDPEGGQLVIEDVQSLTEGIEAEVGSTGQWIAVSVPTEDDLAGRRSFDLTYIVRDTEGSQASGRLGGTLIFDDRNSNPVARPDRAVARQDTPVDIDVLGNDSDRESDTFDLSSIQPPRNGLAEFNVESRQVVYTPGPGFTGSDEFSYTIRDSIGGESTAFVTVGVLAEITQPLPPIARDDNDLSAGDNTQFTFEAGSGTQLLNVLLNDEDPNGTPFSIIELPGLEAFLDGTGATVEILPAGNNLEFSPPAELREQQEVRFEYTIENNLGLRSSAEVTITVLDNLEPIPPCVDDIAVPGEFSAGDVVAISLSGSYSDCGLGGDNATLDLLATGDANVAGAGDNLELSIPSDWTAGSYSFDFAVQDTDEFGDDGSPLVASGTVTVQVVPNQAPQIAPNPIIVDFLHEPGQEQVIALAEFVVDPEADPLTYEALSSDNTVARLSGDSASGQIVYTPNAGFSGQGFFNFIVSDGRNEATARVQFEVIIPNVAPVGEPRFVDLRAGESTPFDITTAFTDADLPDDVLSYEFEQLNGQNVLTVSRSGDVLTLDTPSTTPAGDFQLQLTASDSEGETATATLTVTITPSNAPPPVVPSDAITLLSGESQSVDVLSRSTSNLPDDPTLTLLSAVRLDGEVTAAVQGGALQISVSDPTWSGTAVVEFTVHDARGPDVELARASGTITVTVIGPPSPPGQPDVSVAGPTSILAQWSPPGNDGGSAISGYRVLTNGPDGQREVASNGTQPSLEITGLTAGQPYTVQVIAVNQAGLESDPSVLSGEVRPDQAPGPPGRPDATFVPGQFNDVQVSWGESFNEGSPIEVHEIEVGECGRPGTSVGGESFSAVINLGDSGVRCTFRVRARNATVDATGSPVWSPWSEWSEPECSVGIPDTPNAPSATRGDQLAEVAWQQPDSNDCDPLQRYELRRLVNGSVDGAAKSVAQGVLNDSSAPLQNGETYTFQVRAESRQGWSEWSPASSPVIPCGQPLPPTSVVAERGDTQAPITFTGESDNGCPINSFDVQVNGGNVQPISQGGTVTGLTNGTSYTFRVRGVNEEGTGEWSAPSNSVVPAGPPIIQSVTLGNGNAVDWLAIVDSNGVDFDELSFSASGNVEGSAGSGVINAGVDGGGQDFNCLNREGNRCNRTVSIPTLTCVQSAQTVNINVTVSGEFGSDNQGGSAPLQGCPGSPSLSGSAGNGEVSLSWSRPSGTTAMYLEIGNNGFGVAAGGEISGSSITFAATNGRTETYSMWACNEFGCTNGNRITLTPVDPAVPITIGDIRSACGRRNDPGLSGPNASAISNLTGSSSITRTVVTTSGVTIPARSALCYWTTGTGTSLGPTEVLSGQQVCDRTHGGRFEVSGGEAVCV